MHVSFPFIFPTFYKIIISWKFQDLILTTPPFYLSKYVNNIKRVQGFKVTSEYITKDRGQGKVHGLEEVKLEEQGLRSKD
jgi:hypothetical protein